MKISKYLKISLVFLGLLFANTVSANVGVSPSDLIVDHLLPGTNLSKTIILSRANPDTDFKIDIEMMEGEINDWITVTPESGFIAPEGEQRVPFLVNVHVPKDAKVGNYQGALIVRAVPITKEQVGQVNTVSSVAIKLDLSVTDKDIVEYDVLSIQVPKIKQGDDINTLFKIKNTGNVPAHPAKIHMDVLDVFNNKILESHDALDAEIDHVDPFLPDAMGEILVQSPTELGVGQYWIEVTVYDESDEILKSEKLMLEIEAPGEKPEQSVTNNVSNVINDNNSSYLQGFLISLGAVLLLLLAVIFTRKYKSKPISK